MVSNIEVNALRLMMPEYLAAYRGYEVKLTGNYYTMIECQMCGIADNTPSAQYFHDSGRAICYHTRKSFDIFDLIGEDFGLDKFGDKVRKAKELFSGELDAAVIRQRKMPVPEKKPREKKDYTGMYHAAYANREDSRAREYLSLRGISWETACRYNVGFLPSVKISGMEQGLPCVTFAHIRKGKPEGIAVRFIRAGSPLRWVHFGGYPFYKVGRGEGPVYITEGEIDALSIAECGGRALSIGGTNGVDALLDKLLRSKACGPLPVFLCWLDSDAPGEVAQLKLMQGLRDLGLDARQAELRKGGSWKDANACLLENRKQMQEIIKKKNPADAYKHRQEKTKIYVVGIIA